MRTFAKNLALIVVSLFAALLIGEGVVRIVGAGGTFLTRGRLHCFEPEAGWKCLPNLDAYYCLPGSFNVRVRCNSRGLRGKETEFIKPPGVRRIVVLGDSFMWGYGVENDEMFSSVLEKEITGSESINLGANGYSTVQELVRLETEGLRYDPDWTVLVFCWNDLEDNFDDKSGGRPVALVEEGENLRILNRPVRKPWKSPVKQWFRHHSRLFGVCEYATEMFKAKRKEKRLYREAKDRVQPAALASTERNAKKI
jgi:lysophospholipase L1-like esterase